MHKAKTVVVAIGTGALASALVAGGAVAAPAATAAGAGGGAAAGPTIVVKPGVHQLPESEALSTPWTTALCESKLSIACYEPDQIRTAYNEAPLLQGTANTLYTVNGYSATPGYDLASGVGTINAAYFVPELAGGFGGY